MIIQIILRRMSAISRGIPTMMKHSGNTRTIYRRTESWKFKDAFPFSLIHSDSSFLVSQQIRGPIIPPKGKKKPANADKWQSIDQFLSVSDKTLTSLITHLILFKDRNFINTLHQSNLASLLRSEGRNPLGLFLSIRCWL